MTSSPILFAVYLDELLKTAGLLEYNIMAYADDLVIILENKLTLLAVIEKLESFKSLLQLNKKKSGIMLTGKAEVKEREIAGIPVISTYCYLGVQVSASTKSTID